MIEFADSGMNFSILWLAAPLLVIGVFLLLTDIFWDADTAVFGGLSVAAAVVAIGFIPALVYDRDVTVAQVAALEDHGFTDVTLTEDRFTANDNGEFFSGLLVDLAPEEGYAYRIVNLNDNEGE